MDGAAKEEVTGTPFGFSFLGFRFSRLPFCSRFAITASIVDTLKWPGAASGVAPGLAADGSWPSGDELDQVVRQRSLSLAGGLAAVALPNAGSPLRIIIDKLNAGAFKGAIPLIQR